jgi:hypothetical protein
MPELLDPMMRMLLYAEAQKKLKRKKDALGTNPSSVRQSTRFVRR